LGIESRCAELDLVPTTHYFDGDPKVLRLTEGGFGVITIGWFGDAIYEQVIATHSNVVSADHDCSLDGFDFVGCDLEKAVRTTLDSLKDQKYKRIGMIGVKVRPLDRRGEESRSEEYVRWSNEQGGYDPDLLQIADNSEDDGYQSAKKLLSLPARPDAILTATDNIAVGAYRAIYEANLRIPEDVSVCGMNDIAAARFLTPPLTSVRLPSTTIGRTAVDLLEERIQGRSVGKRVFVESKIIWRGSTRPKEA
jgi:LacI family transcriptional regulator